MAKLMLVSTPMSMATALDLDENGKAIDQREYRSMIGSLLYLTVTRSDIQFTVCLCACFQVSPMLFTSDNSSVNLQVSQIYTRI
jgi:hypothetical protein